MSNNYKLVREFMNKFKQECPDKPTIPSLHIRILRAHLILEEALETIYAIGLIPICNDTQNSTGRARFLDEGVNYTFAEHGECELHQILDGLIDLDVVGRQGTGIAFGFSEDLLMRAEEEVSKSNLSKLWNENDKTHGSEIDKSLTFEQVESAEPNDVHKKVYIATNKNSKVVKPPSYHVVNLIDIIGDYL